MKGNAVMETSYIYFATYYYDMYCWKSFKQAKQWYFKYANECTEMGAKDYVDTRATIKIGESMNLNSRRHTVDTPIDLYVKFEGTKSDRLFIESYLRSMYEANCNMEHRGNDHFRCMNVNTLKGARNKFFTYVAMAFEMLQSINGRQYEWECKSM